MKSNDSFKVDSFPCVQTSTSSQLALTILLVIFALLFNQKSSATVIPTNNGDTVLIQVSLNYEPLSTDPFIGIMSDTTILDLDSLPLESSLWIIHNVNDTLTIQNLVTGKYLSEGKYGNRISQYDQPFYWMYLNQMGRPQLVSLNNHQISWSSNNTLAISNENTGTSIFLYTYRLSFFKQQLACSPQTFFTVDSLSLPITIQNSTQRCYVPTDSSSLFPSIIASTQIAPQFANIPLWCSVTTDSLRVNQNTTRQGRSATIQISWPNKVQSVPLKVVQWNDNQKIIFRHTPGFSQRTSSASLQSVHTREVTCYLRPGDSVQLALPINQLANGTVVYQRWFKADDDANLPAQVVIPHSFMNSFNQKGALAFRAGTNRVYYNADSTVQPLEVACDVSNYLDFDLIADTLWEPTLSYRIIFHIRPAATIAQQFLEHQASGASSSGFLEHYQVVTSLGTPTLLTTGLQSSALYGQYQAYNGAGQLEPITQFWVTIDSVATPQCTIHQGQFLLPATLTLGKHQVDLYGTLTDGTSLRIARYQVQCVSPNQCGMKASPAEWTSESQLRREYNVLKQSTWSEQNGQQPRLPEAQSQLAWASVEVPKWLDTLTLNQSDLMARNGEYQLVSSLQQPWYQSSANSGDRDKLPTFFLTMAPGNASSTGFTLPFQLKSRTDSVRCQLSYQVVNLSNADSTYLMLQIEGSNNDSDYIPLLLLPAGYLNTPVGQWVQYESEFILSKPWFKNYRASLKLEAPTMSEANRNTLLGLQLLTIHQQSDTLACVNRPDYCIASTSGSQVVLASLNYAALNLFPELTDTVATLYLRCVDSLNRVVPLLAPYISPDSTYSTLVIKNLSIASPNYAIYAADSLSLLLHSDSAMFFYLADSVTQQPFDNLYMLFQSNALQSCQNYYLQISQTPQFDLQNRFLQAPFTASGLCFFQKENSEWIDLRDGYQPSDSLTTLSLRYQTWDTDLQSEWRQGYYDWLRGTRQNYDSIAIYGTYNYDTVVVALDSLHLDSTYRHTLVVPQQPTSTLSASQIALINDLVSQQQLFLHRQTIQLPLCDSVNYLLVYPYDSTFLTTNDTLNLFPCKEAIPTQLLLKPSYPYMMFGNYLDDTTNIGAVAIRSIRLALSQLYTDFFIPVTLTNIDSVANLVGGNARLLSTSDTSELKDIGENIYDSLMVVKRNDSLLLEVLSPTTFVSLFKSGYVYRLLFSLINAKLNTNLGYQYLDIYVQPNEMIWNGSYNQSWNNVQNWTPTDSTGDPITSFTPNFVPTGATKVRIASTSNPPVLFATEAQDTGRTTNLTTLLDYQRNTTNLLAFDTAAQLIGQEYLNYDSVWLDLKIPANQWVLMSAPIRGLVSGDFYVASNQASISPFSSGNECTSRAVAPFWQSVYNSYVLLQGADSSTLIGTMGWSDPVNGLTTPFIPRSAFFVWAGTTGTDDAQIVRLPKSETQYAYFLAADTAGEIIESANRPSDYYKLAFITDDWSNVPELNQYSDSIAIAVLGNPFMAPLAVDSFFAYNPQFTGSYWLYRNKTLQAYSSSGFTTSESNSFFDEYEGFFAQMQTDSLFNIQNTRFLTAMTYPANNESNVSQLAEASANVLKLIAGYGGYQSVALLVQQPQADKGYRPGEDVPALALSQQLSPSLLYTVADQKALQINSLSSIQHVPVGFKRIHSGRYGSTFQFTTLGAAQFDPPLQLIDVTTGQIYPLNQDRTLTLELPQNDELRYYITQPAAVGTELTEQQTSHIKLFTPHAGLLIIESDVESWQLKLFDSVGRLLLQQSMQHSQFATCHLVPGVYMVQVETMNGIYCQKVMIY